MPPDSPKTAYEVLELAPDADADEVDRAFRRLALANHPDLAPPPFQALSAEVFAPILRAYAILSDPPQRQRYDDALGRGEVPDLEALAGDPPRPRLVEILQRIPPLGIACDIDELTADMDSHLRLMLAAKDGSGILLDPKSVKEFSEALRNLSLTRKTELDVIEKAEKRASEKATKAAAETAVKVARAKGVTKETIAAIREHILGGEG